MNSELEWNKSVEHPLQAWEWGEFRQKTGIKIVRENGVQVSIHPIPFTKYSIGYYPKGTKTLNRDLGFTLQKIARENNCIAIKCEPKITPTENLGMLRKEMRDQGFTEGRALFTKYNFVLDVSLSEAELLARMKQKTRYNIRVAQKKGVTVELSEQEADFEKYLKLTQETTERQGFYAHTETYHRMMWKVLHGSKKKPNTQDDNSLTAHLLVARYQGEVITTWILFRFKDTLYYPYGASTREHREAMANNLVMWEAIRLAKKWGCKYLDMWGALGENPDKDDPWYGFHAFKQGYAAQHISYIGTWDYVVRPGLYKMYRLAEWLRWIILRTKKLVTKGR